MTYLTRMYLHPRRRQTHRFLRDPQVMHAAVESSFPPGAVEPGRTLWRLDADGDEVKLLILSPREPSLEHLQEQAGWSEQRTWESRPYGQLLARVTKGQRYAFRFTANPVHTVTDQATGKAQKLAHVSVPHQLLWLAQKAEQLGVRFLDDQAEPVPLSDPGAVRSDAPLNALPAGMSSIRVSHREKLRFTRGSQQVTIVRARFEGALVVEDAAQLREALVNGVGRAKAYGCGLVTLAPLRSGRE